MQHLMKRRRISIALLVVLSLLTSLSAGSVGFAAVEPDSAAAVLAPGQSLGPITKTVDVPAVPPKLDLVLLVDLSGSYNDDLPIIRNLAPGLFDAVRAQVADSQFALASFVDYPYRPWGSWTTIQDYAYRLDRDLTTNKADWLAAINAMAVRHGGDLPESQLEALYQIATGAGRQVPPGIGGQANIPAGQNPTFRSGATKIVVMTTDASFHTAGDSQCDPSQNLSPTSAPANLKNNATPHCPFGYPGPSMADTIAALNAAGITVIGIKAPAQGAVEQNLLDAQMNQLVNGTGGVVKTTSANSAELADAILDALEELTFEVKATPVDCGPLQFAFEPATHSNVAGGTQVSFDETITVAEGATSQVVDCTVEFTANGAVIGTQTVSITVDADAPDISATLTSGGESYTPGTWTNQPVDVVFTCDDALDGPVAASGSATFNEGAGQTAFGSCADAVGNVAELTIADINVDLTNPELSVALTSGGNVYTPGTWTNQPVDVTFSCDDDLSGVQSSAGSTTLSEGADQSVTGTCADEAGNTAELSVEDIDVDLTDPEITVLLTSGGNPYTPGTWTNQPVDVTFNCTDGLSGVASSTGSTTLYEGAGQSASGVCTDNAGNSAELTVEEINVDLTAPTCTCTLTPNQLWPANNKMVAVSANVTVSDSLSGTSVTLASVTSNEPDQVNNGDPANDIQNWTVGSDDRSGQLRAQRLGSGTGRVYTITYEVTDGAGNSSTCSGMVVVPHDQGRH
jgi:hypothetical protein